MQCRATRGIIGNCGESAGLALTVPYQFLLQFIVKWSNLPPQIPVTVPETGLLETGFPLKVMFYPVASTWDPNIDDVRQSTIPDVRKSNKLDTSIDGKFTNNLVAPPIFTGVLSDKFSESSTRDIYTRCWMNLAVDTVNIPAPLFVNLGIFTIDALGKCSSLWTPTTRIGSPMDVAHWNATDHIFEKQHRLETLWAQSRAITIKLVLKLGGEIRIFSAKMMQGVDHLWTRLLLVQKFQTPSH